MKIRTRIIVGFFIIVSIAFCYLIRWIIDDLRPHYVKSMEESLVDTATILSSLVAAKTQGDKIFTNDLRVAFDDAYKRTLLAKIYDLEKRETNMLVYVTDKRGMVIFDSRNGRDEGKDYFKWNDVYRTLQGEYGARSTRLVKEDPTTSVLFIASPIIVNREIIGSLTVGKPANSVAFFIYQARNKVIIAGIMAGIAIITLGILLSVWVTIPINKLTNYARSVRDGEKTQLPSLGRSEIGVMGKAFEEMRDALEGKRYVERYIQTLTHEIKSPLSAIRGAAELLNEEISEEKRMQFSRNILTESARIQDIIDRLLELSCLESRKGLKDVVEIEISSIIRQITEGMMPLFEAKKIRLVNKAKDTVIIQGEQFLIRQAIINLLQNAIDFTPQKGTISIVLRKEKTSLSIIIEDTGTGIPVYALDKVFERFYSLSRPDTGRKSTGLGLSFVQEVALLHNGNIVLENREGEGGGARSIFSLPCR